jgi:hypothetical protein
MTDRRAVAIILMLHVAIVAIVQPRGDFPLNDDWAYAHGVQWLLDEGRIRLSPWVGMNLVPQTLAGGAVAALFGFSFETLRHLTQAVAVLAMVAAYAWFRTVRLEPSCALVATLAVVAFPAWPVLANSYMTDLYGLALALPAATFFVATLRDPRPWMLFAATAFSVAGVLERQVVLVIPFAFMVAWYWTRRSRDLRSLIVGAAPFLIAAASAVAYHAYLALGPGVPEGHRMAYGRLLPMTIGAFTNEGGLREHVLSNAAGIAGYLGLFALGWLAWYGMAGASRWQKGFVLVAGGTIGVLALGLPWLPPYRSLQVIDAAGIGPLLLHDSVRGLAALDRTPGVLWRLAAVPAAFATAALALTLGVAAASVIGRGRDADATTVFALAVIAGYLGPFVMIGYFDRYLVFVLPFLFALWARTWKPSPAARWQRGAAIVWIGVALALSAAATRDYFSWNRARWDAIRHAERLGGHAGTIDGGFEYNALRLYEKGTGTSHPSWWWIKDDEYVVAFSGVPGYREIETWRVPHWLSRSPAEVKLLKRK